MPVCLAGKGLGFGAESGRRKRRVCMFDIEDNVATDGDTVEHICLFGPDPEEP